MSARDSLAAKRVSSDNNPWDQFQPFSPRRRNYTDPRRKLLRPLKRLRPMRSYRYTQPTDVMNRHPRSIT